MKAVGPATVSLLIGILSKWECNAELRSIILKCLAKMVYVLYRSSPVERQIELATVFHMYLDVIVTLSKTHQFDRRPFDEKFNVEAIDDDDYIDLNALTATVNNIAAFSMEEQSRLQICSGIVEANFIPTLTGIPKQIQKWEFDRQKVATSVVRALALLRQTMPVVTNILSNTQHITTLFDGIKGLGKPTHELIEQCLEFAYDKAKGEIIFGEIIVHLVDWIKDMREAEQVFTAESLVAICSANLAW